MLCQMWWTDSNHSILRKKSRWHHQCNLVNVKYAKPLFEEAKFWKNVFWHLKQSHRVTTPTCACKSRVKSDAWIQWPKNLQMLLLGQSHWCQLCRMLPGKYILMLCFWQSYIFGRMFLFCCLPFLLGGVGGLLFCAAADVFMVVIIIFIVTFSFSYSLSFED